MEYFFPGKKRQQSRKNMEKINEMKSWFFEKSNKADKPLGRHIKKKKREDSNQ